MTCDNGKKIARLMLALAIVGMSSCSPEHSLPTVGVAEHGTAKAPSESRIPIDATRASELLSVIEKGDVDKSAQALLELAPDGKAVLVHHDTLIRIAESAQGEMNIEILRQACPKYHRWRTRTELTGPDRMVILQWMAQKVWELPKGAEKETAAKAFVGDVDRFIDAGVLETIPGLDMACHAVMAFTKFSLPAEYVPSICPGVSAVPVVRLFEKHASDKNDEVRMYVRNTLLLVGTLIDDHDVSYKDLYDFLKAHYPDDYYPDPIEPWKLFFNPNTSHPPALRWDDYEKLPGYSQEEVRDKMKANLCGRRIPGFFCMVAGDFLADKFDARPDEVTTFVLSVSEEGIFRPAFLVRGLRPEPGNSDFFQQKAGLFDAILGYFERKLTDKDMKTLPEAIDWAKSYLEEMSEAKPEATPASIELEKRLVAILLQAWPIWEKANADDRTGFYGKVPSDALRRRQKYLYPEVQEYLKIRAQQLLQDKQALSNLPPKAQQAMKDGLAALIAMP